MKDAFERQSNTQAGKMGFIGGKRGLRQRVGYGGKQIPGAV